MANTIAELLQKVTDKILVGGRRTTATNSKDVYNSIIISSLNIKDGGFVVESETGYTTEITPTDNKSFATKKYVDENGGGGSQDLQSVTDIGSVTTDTIETDGFIKTGGTSSEFLKADGSVDNTTYASTTYVDSLVVGLWDDRGNYDASVNAYPSSGGSGTAGAILKGDIWTISVSGTLPTAQIVEIGDTVRALVDSPGNTQANWSIQQNNIGYTAENSANKTNTVTGNEASTSLYLSVKGYYDYLIGLVWLTATRFGTWISGLSAKAIPIDTDTIIINDGDAKKTTLTQLKAFLKTYFDTLYGSSFSGTVDYLPKFTSSNTIGNSPIRIINAGASDEYIFNTKRTAIYNTVNNTGDAFSIYKDFTGSPYKAFNIFSNSGGTFENINNSSNVDLDGRIFKNMSSQGYNQYIISCDKNDTEQQQVGVNNGNIILMRRNGNIFPSNITSTSTPPNGYGIGHYYCIEGSSFNAHRRYLGCYAQLIDVAGNKYGFKWVDEDSNNNLTSVRRTIATLDQDGTLTLNPKVAGVGNGFVTQNGAKVGSNTDTAILAGAGSIEYHNGVLSFSNGLNWGIIENDRNIITPTATYTILSTDYILLNAQSSTWTLPSNTSLIGKKYLIYLNNNTLTLNSDGVDLLNGAFFISFSAGYKAIEVRCLASGVWLTNMV